jgi:hypothetical protein
MIRNQSIICFAGEDWWYHHQHSKNHIMRRLARAGNRVIFVNSISMGLPSLASRDLLGKIKRKLRSYARPIRITEEGIVVVSPPVLPSIQPMGASYQPMAARRADQTADGRIKYAPPDSLDCYSTARSCRTAQRTCPDISSLG